MGLFSGNWITITINKLRRYPYNDILTREAIKLAQDNRIVSSAILQIHFNIGVNRSLALMEELQKLKVIDKKGQLINSH